jgi:DNA-binding NtrC family response regulator
MMPPPEDKLTGGLLIVDDRPEVLRALERLLGLYFEDVYCAMTPPEGEAVLKDKAPRYLLCDYWLGEKYPPATGFIPRWRKEHPCLQRVVLMSGTNSASIPPCNGVDQVFAKPLDTPRLIAFFTR